MLSPVRHFVTLREHSSQVRAQAEAVCGHGEWITQRDQAIRTDSRRHLISTTDHTSGATVCGALRDARPDNNPGPPAGPGSNHLPTPTFLANPLSEEEFRDRPTSPDRGGWAVSFCFFQTYS